MDGRSGRVTKFGRAGWWRDAGRRLAAGLILGFAVCQAASPAGASPIRRHSLIVVNDAQSLGPAWARFLAGGPSLWSLTRPPRVPSGLVLPTRLGALIETPFVDYLAWRRALNIARFDRNHPSLGPALGLLVPPSRSTPGVVTTGVTPRPFNPAPQNLPEPGAFAVALVLFGAGLRWCQRTRPVRTSSTEG